MRIAVVSARFNAHVTLRLLEGVRRGLESLGVAAADVTEAWVPGAFELPLAAQTFAKSGRIDAVICLGCVIRGETTHYESVAGECARGIQDAQLATGVPIVFGVLTTEDLDQALARSESPGGHNVGEEGAGVAVEMATLVRTIGAPS
ncbi:MAG TPA: 6,7-dimethyl-8-ribityllumazine synthase [Acidimicrobiales bacterium]|jgi:6,7-dimethyl-8-ribityllumazine synthase